MKQGVTTRKRKTALLTANSRGCRVWDLNESSGCFGDSKSGDLISVFVPIVCLLPERVPEDKSHCLVTTNCELAVILSTICLLAFNQQSHFI